MAGKGKLSWNIYDFIGTIEMQDIYISDFNHVITVMKSITTGAGWSRGRKCCVLYLRCCVTVFFLPLLFVSVIKGLVSSYGARRDITGLSPSNLHSTRVAVPITAATL